MSSLASVPNVALSNRYSASGPSASPGIRHLCALRRLTCESASFGASLNNNEVITSWGIRKNTRNTILGGRLLEVTT